MPNSNGVPQIGLNKGEAHHALKRAISFHRRGEIRDRSAEGQHYRIAGMNLLAAIIIFWNTMKLGEVVANQKRDGKLLSPDLLAPCFAARMGTHQSHRRISLAKALA